MRPSSLRKVLVVARPRVVYEFFTDRSGLPDGHFAMVVFGIGTAGSWHFAGSGMGIRRALRPVDHGSHCLSSGLLSCLRFPSFRPPSMDAEFETQDHNAFRR
jgi:hypothetical protein